jgi:hypothetical protein
MTERGISAETGILSAPEPSAEYNPEPEVDVDQIMERLKSEQPEYNPEPAVDIDQIIERLKSEQQ